MRDSDGPMFASRDCGQCGREWYGPYAQECPDCRLAGGSPPPCLLCKSKLRWVSGEEAECDGCDARYPLAKLRTYLLGELVERIAEETPHGSAEEVGRIILAAGRPAMRRVP